MWRYFSLGGPIHFGKAKPFTLATIVVVAFIALYLLCLAVPAAKSDEGSKQSPVANAPDKHPTSLGCKTVSPHTYNNLIRLERKLDGHSRRPRSRPVCVATFKRFKAHVKHTRKECKSHAITTGASFYGGPSDGSSGTQGAYGPLSGTISFAELDMGTGLGGLAPRSWWFLRHGKHRVRAQKLDIGAGGGPINGVHRGIDLWHETLAPLGLSDNAVIQVSKHDCWA